MPSLFLTHMSTHTHTHTHTHTEITQGPLHGVKLKKDPQNTQTDKKSTPEMSLHCLAWLSVEKQMLYDLGIGVPLHLLLGNFVLWMHLRGMDLNITYGIMKNIKYPIFKPKPKGFTPGPSTECTGCVFYHSDKQSKRATCAECLVFELVVQSGPQVWWSVYMISLCCGVVLSSSGGIQNVACVHSLPELRWSMRVLLLGRFQVLWRQEACLFIMLLVFSHGLGPEHTNKSKNQQHRLIQTPVSLLFSTLKKKLRSYSC